MQTDNRLLDGMARFFTNAAGAAQAFKAEMETMMKARFERLVADLDLVPREEFDAVKAMAPEARAKNENLAPRVAEWKKRLGSTRGKPASGARKPRKARGNTKRV